MKKKDVKNALAQFNKSKQEIKTKPVIQKVKAVKKVGRPTEKDATKSYTRISAKILETTKTKMKVALYRDFKDKYRTQDELVNDAILAFVESKK